MQKDTYASRHLVGSNPDYAELNRIQMMLCYAYNPSLALHASDRLDIEPLLIPSLIDTLKTAQGELMEEGNWKDFHTAWAAPFPIA